MFSSSEMIHAAPVYTEEKMKQINKKKIESVQPSQKCKAMNQQNKFSPEINKHDISGARKD